MARGRVSHFQQRDREFVGGSSKVTATCRGNVSAAIFPNEDEACRSSSPEKCQATFIRDDGDHATVEVPVSICKIPVRQQSVSGRRRQFVRRRRRQRAGARALQARQRSAA
nr:hypothetical protein Itr_chr01CG09240 [Ipomoea trifida]